jgi:hypothetical protein
MGLLGTLLGIGATLDWITPAGSLVVTSRDDRLAVDADDIRDAERALRRSGIGYHRGQIINGQYVFDVDRGSGPDAERILKSRGLL